MKNRSGWLAASLSLALSTALATALTAAPAAAENIKRGGILTYMIPADAPPSLDGHKENTYATLHATAPFYSTLIAINPDNPSSSTDFGCDLCPEMPKATADGKTNTFKIRKSVSATHARPIPAAAV